MKQKTIGTYDFGYGYVEIVLREGNGGEFYLRPGKGLVPRVKIGYEQDRWDTLLGILIHELFELASSLTLTRYNPSEDQSQDHGQYLFVLTHTQLTECQQRTAEVLSQCYDSVKKYWERMNKK